MVVYKHKFNQYVMTDIAFHDQTGMYGRTYGYTLNPLHRPYPKMMHIYPAVISVVVKDIVLKQRCFGDH